MFDGSLPSCRLLFRVYFHKSGSICAAAPEISSKSSGIDQLEPSSSSSSWSSSLVLWGIIRGDLFLCYYNWSRFLFACSLGEDMTFSIPLVNNLVLFLLLWVVMWMYLWSLSVQHQKDMPGYCLSLISLLFIRRLFHSPLQIDILALLSSSSLPLSLCLCALQAGYVCRQQIYRSWKPQGLQIGSMLSGASLQQEAVRGSGPGVLKLAGVYISCRCSSCLCNTGPAPP
jgi:hypothetical protein